MNEGTRSDFEARSNLVASPRKRGRNVTSRSQYDDLHDLYQSTKEKKAGTRYERLTALVLKSLEEQRVVVHDVKLIGETGVKHQIDVRVEVNGVARRVLVECKDFDVSGEKVGLDIARNFWAVVEDTKPTESMIITCTGFTQDAAAYCKAKGIKLVVLRRFTEKDWAGRIRTIVVNITAQMIDGVDFKFHIRNQEDGATLVGLLSKAGLPTRGVEKGSPVYLVLEDGQRHQFNEYMETKLNALPRDKEGHFEHVVPLKDARLWVADLGSIPLDAVTMSVEVQHMSVQSVATSQKVAELIVAGLGDRDLVIFDETLKSFQIAENGEVTPA